MIDPSNTEIDVDEIMRKIREEVKRRKILPEQETVQEPEPLPSESLTIEDNSSKKSFDHSVTQPPLPSPVDINVLPYYINYHGFLVQVKEKEGLKGRIKNFLFKFIRFYAWWQEQINRALYQELVAQKAKMDERDRWIQELLHQQISQAKDELSRGLTDQRMKIVETGSHLEGLLNKQSDHLRNELAERDKVLGDLGNKVSLFGQAKDELSRELSDQKNKINETGKWVESLFNQGMDNLKFEFNESYKNLNDAIESTKKELSGLLEVKSAIHQMAEEIRNHKLEILDQQRRLTLLLEEARKRLPKPFGPKQIKNILKEEDHLLDAMYVAFEDRFRGTREEIKERLRIYLPYVKQAKIGEKGSPILDLGCGRGEWLELLKENGYVAKGVDFNRGMVRQCQQFGLDVTESDMIEYLRNQQPNSFGALTGFHIIEHLSFKTLISLFDEVLRVLKSGGMVIFETPNPENLIVGACNFYFDPSHRNPLPPRLLNFLIESRGFGKTEIIRLHPLGFFQEEQKTSVAIKELATLFNAGQDYSVIAYKG